MEITNSKQQQLTFDKGITNVPSDAICSDNTLEECVGMIYDDNEYRPIQKPVESVELPEGHTILYIHVYNGFTRYITSYDDNLYWIYNNTEHLIKKYAGNVSVESIGNTLILSDDNGLTYMLWDTNSETPAYKVIGSNVPNIEMRFRLTELSNTAVDYPDKYIDLSELFDGIIVREGQLDPVVIPVAGNKYKNDRVDDAQSGLIGLASKRLNQIKEAKRFAFPFFVRYAIRLYDGTYTNVSNPILLMPTVRNNWNIFACDRENGNIRMMDGDAGGMGLVNYKPLSAKLTYEFSNVPDLTDWQDIISGVDIFVSEEVKTYDMDGTWIIQNCYMNNSVNPLFANNAPVMDFCTPEYEQVNIQTPSPTGLDYCYTYYQPPLLSDDEIIKKLVDASVFYLLLEVDSENIQEGVVVDSSTVIQRGVLENLTEQTQLKRDDYFSRAPLYAQIIKSYNNRLHLANIKRGFFEGFTHFSYSTYSEPYKKYSYFVHIKTDSGVRIAKAVRASDAEIVDVWFFYPDPRAFKVQIFNDTDNSLIGEYALKEHPRLNGAYLLRRLPTLNETRPSLTGRKPATSTDFETIDEHLFVSEVNNPYVFTSSGDVTIRMGKIIGLSTQTMSLGEMEHGIHPLTVFSEKGISLLRLASDGTYTRSDEISREVCNNPSSITETDGPVFFSSEKGLMVVAGSQTKCVSEQLNGKSESPFQDYLKSAYIAYDYRDSLLWIFNGSEWCYIYSIKSGTFSRYAFDNVISAAINNYPDYLLQSGTKLYSLLNRPNINSLEEQNNSYSGQMITRPMKLENAFALKKLIQIMHVHQMEGSLSLRIFASNNLKREASTWVELHSLLGTPWKYYKFQYDFTGLKATDRFAGTVVVTTEERTDKLR